MRMLHARSFRNVAGIELSASTAFCIQLSDEHIVMVAQHLARNSALCRVMEVLLRLKDVLFMGADSKLLSRRLAMRRLPTNKDSW